MAELWEFITHHWAALSIAATCISLLTFALLLLTKYVRICLNIFTDTPLPLSIDARDFEIIQGEEVRFRSFDGTSLRGMWLRTKGPMEQSVHDESPFRKGTVVFCHEFGSDMYSCARYARPLIEAGFDVFTFDYRGHGDSSRPRNYRLLQWPSDRELEDTLGACAFVEDTLSAADRPTRIGIFGISRGAGAAILAASSDPNIACIMCDGAFSTTETLVTLMKRWASIFGRVKLVYQNHPDAFWRFLLWCMMRFAQPRLSRRFPSVRKALANMISRPIMLIHGERDSYIRSDQAELLHRAAGKPKYLWIVPKAKHNQSVTTVPDEYAARTTAFFRKYLADEAVDENKIAGLGTCRDESKSEDRMLKMPL